jgi:hypothetical protein
MRWRIFVRAFVLASCFVSASSIARADDSPSCEPDLTEPCPTPPSTRRELDATLGGGAFADGVFGRVASLNVTARRGWFAFGAILERGGEPKGERRGEPNGGYDYVGAAPAVGVALPTPSFVRVDVLGVMGVHHFWSVGPWRSAGQGGGNVDEGASGATLFAGARLFAGLRLPTKTIRLVAGVIGFADADARRTVAHSYQAYTVLESKTVPTTREIGETRGGAMIAVGGSLDL